MSDYDDDYEVVPMTPLRRMEERIRKLEQTEGKSEREFILDVMDLVKSNQKLVDEVVKANHALRQDLQHVTGKMDQLLDSWSDFMTLLKKAATEEAAAAPAGLEEKFDRLIELNEQVLQSNEDMKDELKKQRKGGRSRRRSMPEGTSKYPRIRVKGSDRR